MQHFVYDESWELRRQQPPSLLVISSLAVRLIAKLDVFLERSAFHLCGVACLSVGYRFLFACFEQCIVRVTSGGGCGTREVREDIAIGCTRHWRSKDVLPWYRFILLSACEKQPSDVSVAEAYRCQTSARNREPWSPGTGLYKANA